MTMIEFGERKGKVTAREAEGCVRRLDTFQAGAMTGIRDGGTYLVLSYDQVIARAVPAPLGSDWDYFEVSTRKWSPTTSGHQSKVRAAWSDQDVNEVRYYTAESRPAASELSVLPTLCQGQADDLKWESEDRSLRFWLSRTGVSDGQPWENMVTIERQVPDGWIEEVYDGGDLCSE